MKETLPNEYPLTDIGEMRGKDHDAGCFETNITKIAGLP